MVRTSRRPFTGALARPAAVLTALVLTVAGLSVAGLTTATSASASDPMLSSVNAARADKGRSSLAWNSHLARVAGEQASRMAKKGKLYHNPNLASDVGNYRWVGENVGYGPSSSSIFKAFMNSAGHRANILDDDFTQIGIASVRDGDGRLWVAQVFRQPLGGSGGGSDKSSGTAKKKKSSAKKKPARTSTVKKKTTRTTTTSAPAKATPKATKPARPKPPVPAPAPTLAQRVSQATAAQDPVAGDPLADALAFAATMNAVGG